LHPTQRTQRTQRKERKGRNAMTSLLDRPTADGSGQSQPPATTAYAAGTLPSCGRHAIKYEIIEMKSDLHHESLNK